MKIVVCLKQVPTRDAPLQVDQEQLWLQQQDTRYETNEADQYALEQALCIKDQIDSELIVISLGPARVHQILKEALAKGADRAIHIDIDNPHTLDPLQQANAIAEALANPGSSDSIDLLLTGLQSDDMGFGQTGVMIASCLQLPHASMVVELQQQDNTVKVKRELEAGWFQWLSLSMPCVLTIQSGNRKPRYANMKGILAAKKKPIDIIPYSDLNSNDIISSQQVLKIYAPEKNKQTEYIDGSDDDIATNLLDKLNISSIQ